jgi:hypothetical protein
MIPEVVIRAPRWRSPNLRTLAPPLATTGAFVVVSLAIVGPMFGAQFGAIDDHQIPYTLTLSGGLPWPGVPSMVAFWITHDPGRFRPLYWVLRVAETALWHENVAGWYLDRLALAIATLASAYALARLWWSPLVATVAALVVIAGPQAEAWGRLGPQEAYAVPLLLAGLAVVGRRQFVAGIVLLVLAAVAKESFLPLAVLGVAWAWFLGSRRAALAGFLAVAAVGIGLLLVELGSDYYGLPRTLSGMAAFGIGVLGAGAVASAWPVVDLVALALRARLPWFTLLGTALVVLLPQAIIYAGIGLEGRYLLPAAFAWILLVGAALQAVRGHYHGIGIALAVLVLLLAGWQTQGQATASVDRAAATRTWAAAMTKVRNAMRGRLLVVQVSNPADVEVVIALRRYVAGGRAMLAPPPPPTSQFGIEPYKQLAAISMAGGSGFAPYERPSECLEVDIGTVPAHVCAATLRL